MPKATPPSVVMTDTHAVLILPITDSARPNATSMSGTSMSRRPRFGTYSMDIGQARRERLTYERAHDLRAHVDEDDEQHEADGEQVSSDPSGQIGEQRAEAEQWFRG